MRFFNTAIIKIVWDRFTKAFKYLQQPTDWDKCWPLLMLTGQVMRHHNKWPRMCNYFLIADYKKCIFPSPKQSGWDIINVRNPERQCLLWHGVLISDNKELSLYSEIRLKVRLRWWLKVSNPYCGRCCILLLARICTLDTDFVFLPSLGSSWKPENMG